MIRNVVRAEEGAHEHTQVNSTGYDAQELPKADTGRVRLI